MAPPSCSSSVAVPVPAGIDTEGVADMAGLGDCANSPAAGSTVQAVKRASV